MCNGQPFSQHRSTPPTSDSMFSDEFSVRSTPMNQHSSNWTPQQNKLFECALAVVPEDAPDRWHRISGFIGVKSPAEVRCRYEELLHDLSEIESGHFTMPNYSDDGEQPASETSQSRPREGERRKGVPWTEEEHRLFLIGLQKYGKGDWRSISRNAVISRTPTQVASHAQKYFLRLNSVKKEKKRSSIHDTTAIDGASTFHSPSAIINSVWPWSKFGDRCQSSPSTGVERFGY